MNTCSQHGEIQSPALHMNYQAVGKRNSGRPLRSLLDSDIETGSGHLTFVPEYDS